MGVESYDVHGRASSDVDDALSRNIRIARDLLQVVLSLLSHFPPSKRHTVTVTISYQHLGKIIGMWVRHVPHASYQRKAPSERKELLPVA